MKSPATRPGSPGPFPRAIARLVLAVFLLTLPGSPPARADFSGEEVVAGDAIVEQRGNLIWIQASDGSIIQFDLLNVWSHEELHARLPDAGSRILLDVLQGPTHVDGGLFSNGTVYILNPAGIFFGAEAVVDVHGLVAAAGTLQHEDFQAGTDRFELSGVVENAGRIEAPRVALLGTVVRNRGDIVAPDGTIALVAGERALLTRLGGHLHVQVDGAAGGPDAPAIEHTGTADAGRGQVSFTTGDVWSVAINHEGITRGRDVALRAESGTVRVSGRIDATAHRLGATGGDVAVTGERVALVGADIDASGFAGGGRIRVGGDLRGEGGLATAKRTFVDAGSVLRADGILRGDGGEVVVWADEATAFHGAISARGGALAGRGGFAEISGGRALWSTGDVDLRAPRGATGTLLYDPQDIEIVGGAGDGSDDPDADPGGVVGDDLGQVLFADVGDGSTPFQIFESEIEGTNANVILEATHSIASTGTFTNDASGEGAGVLRIVDGNDLTMRTRNDPGDADGSVATPGIDLSGLAIRTGGGGSVTLETGDGAIAVGGIDTSGADGATGGDAGSIEILAGDADASATSDITVTGDLVARGGAGTAGAGGAGGRVSVRSEGVEVELDPGRPETTVIRGGGAVVVADVDARGGGSDTGDGGAGGVITVVTDDGTIATGDLDASGGGNVAGDGAAGGAGGDAGAIGVATVDALEQDANTVTTGTLTARGGDGAAGAGGAGGTILARSLSAPRVDYDDDMDPETEPVTLQEGLGGGDVTVQAVVSSGGSGTSGGDAGDVTLVAGGAHAVDAAAGITARGGAGSGGDGGAGGAVAASAQDGDVTTGAIDTRGGDGSNAFGDALGGAGGSVSLIAGQGEDASGDLLLQGAIDARAGTGQDAEAMVPGGGVSLTAADTVEHAGLAEPQIRTSDFADIALEGREVGADGAFVVQGGEAGQNRLFLTATDRGDVEARDVGFAVVVTARSTTADIDVRREGGGTVFDVSGSGSTLTLNRADSSPDGANLQIALENPAEGPEDGTLEIATGSVTTGGNFVALSHGDIVVGDGDGTAIEFVESVAEEPVTPRLLSLRADNDGDGSGFLRDAPGSAVGRIDLTEAVGDERPTVLISAGEGIGLAGDPLVFVGGGNVSAVNNPRIANPDAGDDSAPPVVPDPAADTGIFLRNTGSGDLAISRRNVNLEGAVVTSGSGDIEITNDAGDLIVEGRVAALPQDSPFDEDMDPEGPGGDVTLAATAPGASVVLSTLETLESGGAQIFASPVTVQRNARLLALGGVDFQGTVDTVANAFSEASLDVTFEGTARLGGAVGGQRALSALTLTENAEDTGTVLVETDTVQTVDAQEYAADVEVGGTSPVTLASARGRVAFLRDLDAAAGADAPLAISARQVVFEGDVGSGAAPAGLATLAPGGVAFTGEGDQSVATGDDGILFDTGAGTAPPPAATVWKTGGGLDLASTGSVQVADGQKLSVQGALTIDAPQVRVTDLSALSVDVTSPDLQVFARQGGAVRAADGRLFPDAGTDIVANQVRFSSAPQVVGAGRAPRIATADGSAEGAGSLAVTRLPVPLAEADFLSLTGDVVLDLAIPAPDPGHETPELEGGPVEVPQPLRVTDTAADPGPAPAAAEVVDYLACADAEGAAARPGCGEPPRARAGSPLDTPRARELAAAYRELLGDAPSARAGRDALAAAAARPGALPDAEVPEAGRRYLVDVAHLLARTRLLGLDEATHDRVRADVLTAVRDAVGAPGLDVAGLEAAVRASRPGLRI